MIKKIKSLKNLAVFNNYRSNGDLKDFNDKNIIYGWNYSGKTTLSRLFSFLNKNSQIDSEYSSVEFEVELTDSHTSITQNNRNESPLSISVFNSDFVRDNLRFESDDKKIKGITFDVGGGVEIRTKIKDNETYIEKGKQLKRKSTLNITKFNEIEAKFTKEAGRIKNDCFNSLIEFDKGHLKRIIGSLHNSLETYTSVESNELLEIKANALALNPKEDIIIQTPELQFEELYNEIKIIMYAEPTKTDDDPILSFHTDLYEWTKQGYNLYQDKNPKINKCAFCGNEIAEKRFQYLNAFYSNEAAKIRTKISEISNRIKTEKLKVENLEWSKKSTNDLIESCQQEFSSLLSQYSTIKTNYSSLLDVLQNKLDYKNNDSLFINTEIGEISKNAYIELLGWIAAVKKIFEKHKDTVNKFEDIQKKARETYKKYLVATFLKTENYYEIKRYKEIEEKFQFRCDTIIKKREVENATLFAQLKTITKGKEKINEFIKLFLNREDVLIDVTTDDYFILRRGDKIAKNLSEGEKTAIAFSHFMVTLGSLYEDKKLQDTIVFIDDPISSLDANHIAQVSSMINSFFFRKGLDEANPEKVVNCFKQLFISTHNFEFYSFLKDGNNIKRKKKTIDAAGKVEEVPACNSFMVKRLSKEESVIQNMPKALHNFNSEYIYLFSEIEQFKEENYPEDKSYMMPNIIRRFLEIYTLIKLPGNSDEIDNRIKILIGDVNELKILHNFSHFTSFERATKHSELIFIIEDVITDMFKLLGKDKEHLNSLYEGIGKKKLVK